METTDRYEILEATVGEGGYGRIDKARDTELERDVAIKILDPIFKDRASAEDIERFRREAKVLARLSHQSIPAIYDVKFSDTKKEFKIIFAWIEGNSIRKHLTDKGVFTLEEARTIVGRICSALEHAHAEGIIHRDVKPSNVILTPDMSSCYLVDFGISLREADERRITDGTPVGTPGYMSPEQEGGKTLTPASDVFSLGILLYECLCGTKPAIGSYRLLSAHNESIPPGIDTLIQEALREEPERRPSVKEFKDRFNKATQPHANFTTTLAEGALYEIQMAVSQMDPNSFSRIPPGQRILIKTRIKDLVSVDEPKMRSAVASFLAALVKIGHKSKPDFYESIISYSLEYGYDKKYGDKWYGNSTTRRSLSDVVLEYDEVIHKLAAQKVLSFIRSNGLESKDKWYLHDLRDLLQNLLTNPVCEEATAEQLGAELARVNDHSHGTGSDVEVGR